ncbi:MAG: GGDEF domain-containing protein [Hyphomicrobiales bacterium]|nr:GGDEF domain-containing protein [Alphaproteobacteria bacterium]
MILDQATLVTVASAITGLLGIFMLMLWVQERGIRALAWWGGAYLMGATAVTLWGAQGAAVLVSPEIPNAFLFVSCGMIWSGARLFHGRPVLPGALFAGATAWVAVMQSPDFAQSGHARLIVSAVLIAFYAFLTAFELRRERRRTVGQKQGTAATELVARLLRIGVPMLHSAVFLAPVGLILLAPMAVSADGLFALFAFETILYVVGTAFIVLVVANERVTHVHKTAAMTDLLTGLFNRRAFLDAANRIIESRGRKSLPVSVLLFDLDKFKLINDRFGHAVGDDALKVFAATAAGNLRSTDVIGRIGGEEFACIIPGAAQDAALVAERLRAAFEADGVVIAGHELHATVSIGVAVAIPPVAIDPLLARADAALYLAKNNGRNRVEFDQGDTPKPKAATQLADKRSQTAAELRSARPSVSAAPFAASFAD